MASCKTNGIIAIASYSYNYIAFYVKYIVIIGSSYCKLYPFKGRDKNVNLNDVCHTEHARTSGIAITAGQM